jgi:hypothetical protein
MDTGSTKKPGRYAHMGRLGMEELKTYFRQGLAEIRGFFYQDSRIAQPPDPGMYGVISHGEAADLRRSIDRSVSEPDPARRSVLEEFERGRDGNRDEGPAPQRDRSEPAREQHQREEHQTPEPERE